MGRALMVPCGGCHKNTYFAWQGADHLQRRRLGAIKTPRGSEKLHGGGCGFCLVPMVTWRVGATKTPIFVRVGDEASGEFGVRVPQKHSVI